MKKTLSFILLFLLCVAGAAAKKAVPAKRDLGFFRNWWYENSVSRRISYYVINPEGTDIYKYKNEHSEIIFHAPYGASVAIAWCEDDWCHVYCDDLKAKVKYNGYIRTADVAHIVSLRVTNPKGARTEESEQEFSKRKKNFNSFDYNARIEKYDGAAEFGFFRVREYNIYCGASYVRAEDVAVDQTEPLVLEKSSLRSYTIRSKDTCFVYMPTYPSSDYDTVRCWTNVGFIPDGAKVEVEEDYRPRYNRELTWIYTLDQPEVIKGFVLRTKILAHDGKFFSRCSWNINRVLLGFGLTRYIHRKSHGVLNRMYEYFTWQTTNPHKYGWAKWKGHFWFILLWMVVAFILMKGVHVVFSPFLEVIFYLWSFVPPMLYLMTNPNSLWFVNPDHVGYFWMIVGCIPFIFIFIWFWTNFKHYALLTRSGYWWLTTLRLVYGWGCLFVLFSILAAISEQELVILYLVLIACFVKNTNVPPEQGCLITDSGERIYGHYDGPDRFFGNDGHTYVRDFGSTNWHQA